MNEWFQELQREALDEDPEWEEDKPAKAIQNAPLAKIFGHALQPLLSEKQVAAYLHRPFAAPLHCALLPV